MQAPCNNFPLISYKRIDFELFQIALDIILMKLPAFGSLQRRTDDGFNKILSIRASMNLGLTDKLKLAFPNILAIEKPIREN